MARGSRGMYDGHEKEPPSRFGGRGSGGRHPAVHSHSARPKRHIKAGGRKRHAK